MKPKVSFYTACMGRLHHLRQTLPRNIEWAASYGNVEFVVLDYNSPDGLEEWAKGALLAHIRSGRVVYAKAWRPQHFEMAKARNVAALLTSGSVVCNLDADNFLGEGFVEHLAGLVEREAIVHSPGLGGSYGRIATCKEDFLTLGGYDERFKGWGCEDWDLINRAKAMGFVEKTFDHRYDLFIDHSDEERARFLSGPKGHTWAKQEAMSKQAISAGRFVANRGKSWGCEEVLRNFSGPVPVGAQLPSTRRRHLVISRGLRMVCPPKTLRK